MRLECKHWVHPKCLDQKSPDFESCVACKGEVKLNIPMVDETEPDAIGTRDYIQQPLSNSFFTTFTRHLAAKKEPFKWIMEKSPLEWMIRDKGFGLQMMIQAGVTFDDFIKAGYTWTDLKAFKDFGKPERIERARDALFALKLNAEHLRDYPHLVESMVSDLKISAKNIVELYGLQFPENTCKPMFTSGGRNEKPWLAKDLVALGFKMDDLYGAGIEYVEQYAYLEPTNETDISMNVTDEALAKLPSLKELEKQRREAEELVKLKLPPIERDVPEVKQIISIPEVKLPPTFAKGPRLHGLKK